MASLIVNPKRKKRVKMNLVKLTAHCPVFDENGKCLELEEKIFYTPDQRHAMQNPMGYVYEHTGEMVASCKSEVVEIVTDIPLSEFIVSAMCENDEIKSVNW